MRMPSLPNRWKVGQEGYPPRKPLLIRIYLQYSLSIYCIYIYILYNILRFIFRHIYTVYSVFDYIRILVYIDSDPCPYFLCHVPFSSEML